MVKHLDSRGYKVTVASIARSHEEAAEGRGLKDFCHELVMAEVREPWQSMRMVARLPTLVPSSMGYFYSAKLQKSVDSLVSAEKFDLIFVHCSSVAQYVSHIRHIPKILDFGDMDSAKWLDYTKFKGFPLNLGYALEGIKLKRAEKKLATQFDMCTCTTKAELNTLNSYDTGAETDWFPNGVDHDFFKPDEEPERHRYDPNTLCFIGRMDYYPNQQCMFEFCAHTLPLIRRQNPAARLMIVGADPTESVKKLESIDGVTVTGTVPDVRLYARRAAVMVAPLNIARGTQNKILEAMAMEVPVVCSEQAAGGVDALPGEHFLVASSYQQYADAILGLMNNSKQRQALARAGRARMRSHHHWPNSLIRLEKIIDRCLKLNPKTAVGRSVRNCRF